MKIARLISLFVTLLLWLTFAQAQDVVLTSWNLEWLASEPAHNIEASQRNPKDVAKLRHYFDKSYPHILAFQEVSDISAITEIVGQDYHIFMSDRARPNARQLQFDDINQYTGFAIRKGLKVTNYPDLTMASSKSSKLRFATYLSIETGNKEVHLLSVHLKAGCRGKLNKSRSCDLLKNEAQAINRWIRARVAKGESYLILGDFNHNLSFQGDWLLSTISEEISPKPNLASKNTKAKCQVPSKKRPGKLHAYRNLIDHLIASPDLKVSEPVQLTYTEQDVLNYKLSDHCPLTSTLLM